MIEEIPLRVILADNDCATGVRTQYCREIGVFPKNFGACQKTDSTYYFNGTIQYGIVNIYPPKPKELVNSTCNLCLASEIETLALGHFCATFVQLIFF